MHKFIDNVAEESFEGFAFRDDDDNEYYLSIITDEGELPTCCNTVIVMHSDAGGELCIGVHDIDKMILALECTRDFIDSISEQNISFASEAE